MKKLYTSLVFILAFVFCKQAIYALAENMKGFATAELSGSFSVTVLSIGLVIVAAATAYKLTPRI